MYSMLLLLKFQWEVAIRGENDYKGPLEEVPMEKNRLSNTALDKTPPSPTASSPSE